MQEEIWGINPGLGETLKGFAVVLLLLYLWVGVRCLASPQIKPRELTRDVMLLRKRERERKRKFYVW